MWLVTQVIGKRSIVSFRLAAKPEEIETSWVRKLDAEC